MDAALRQVVGDKQAFAAFRGSSLAQLGTEVAGGAGRGDAG
jgi:hypothetical protein